MIHDVLFNISLIGDPYLKTKKEDFKGERTEKAEILFAITSSEDKKTTGLGVKLDKVYHWENGSAIAFGGEGQCIFFEEKFKPSLELAIHIIKEIANLINEEMETHSKVKDYNLGRSKAELNEKSIEQIKKMLDDFNP